MSNPVQNWISKWTPWRSRAGSAACFWRGWPRQTNCASLLVGQQVPDSNNGEWGDDCIQALGDVHLRLAEYEAARERYEQSLPVYRGIGDQVGEINCFCGLADLDRQAERWGDAEEKYRRALVYYQEIGMAFNVAVTLQRLGHTAKGAGDPAQARDHYRAALELFTQIGSPTAKEVQADLDGLDG